MSIARLEIDVSALLLDDMDDDGDVDLLLAPTQQEQLHVARNDPNAGSDAFSFEEGVPLSVLGDPHTLTLGDVEGANIVDDVVATIEEDSASRQVWAFYAFDGADAVRTLWTLSR